MKNILKILLFFALVFQLNATTYYVSSSLGNDANNGTSQVTPWKTTSHLYYPTLNPDDSVLLKRGDTFFGEITSQYSNGTPGHPIVFGAYGTGAKPIIYGDVNTATGWTSITRFGSDSVWAAPMQVTNNMSYGYQDSLGYRKQMKAFSGSVNNVFFYLSNQDSLKKALSILTPMGFCWGDDTCWVKTWNGLTPSVEIFREANFIRGSYVTVRDWDCRNVGTAVKALSNGTITGVIVRNLTVHNCQSIAIFLTGHYVNCIVDSCRIDSAGYTAIYDQFGSNNLFKYDTVTNTCDTILNCPVNGSEVCGIGLQQDTNCVVEYGSFTNCHHNGLDTYYNVNDTVRYNTFSSPNDGVYLNGEGWVCYNNNITTTTASSGIGIRADLHYNDNGTTKAYNNTMIVAGSGQVYGSNDGNGTMLFHNNIVTAKGPTNARFDDFQNQTNLTSINNTFYGTAEVFNAGLWPSEHIYPTLSAFQTATGFESGTTYGATISYVSGNAQSGTVTNALSLPFTVLLDSASGAPAIGETVTFAIKYHPIGSTGESLSSTSATTNAGGIATSTLTLGTLAGIDTITATNAGYAFSPITFTATGTAAGQALIGYSPAKNNGGFELDPDHNGQHFPWSAFLSTITRDTTGGTAVHEGGHAEIVVYNGLTQIGQDGLTGKHFYKVSFWARKRADILHTGLKDTVRVAVGDQAPGAGGGDDTTSTQTGVFYGQAYYFTGFKVCTVDTNWKQFVFPVVQASTYTGNPDAFQFILRSPGTEIILDQVEVDTVTPHHYYVSSSKGNDSANGVTTTMPWKTMDKVSHFTFVHGDTISFAKGDTFYQGELSKTGAGWVAGSDSGIVINSYGTGAKPILYGDFTGATWTHTTEYGVTGVWQTFAGFCDGSSGYEYYGGVWNAMTHANTGIQANRLFYLNNPDSLKAYLQALTTDSYGPGDYTAPEYDTVFVKTHDGLTPNVHIFRTNVLTGSYLMVRDLEFRNWKSAVDPYTGSHEHFCNLEIRDNRYISIFLSGGTSNTLVDSCRVDTSGYDAFYSFGGNHNVFNYDTVKTVCDTVLKTYSHVELAGIGFQQDTACVANHCLFDNAQLDAYAGFYNVNDTIRYCNFTNMPGSGLFPNGEGTIIRHDSLWITGSSHSTSAVQVDLHGGSGVTKVDTCYINTTGSGLVFNSNDGTGTLVSTANKFIVQAGGNRFDDFQVTTGLTSTNNNFNGAAYYNSGLWPAEHVYTTLAAFHTATGFETGSTSGASSSIALISGSGQNLNVLSTLVIPIIAQVIDANSLPVAGVTVTSSITGYPSYPNGETVYPASATTNSSGYAYFYATAGRHAGTLTLSIASTGLTGSPLSATITIIKPTLSGTAYPVILGK